MSKIVSREKGQGKILICLHGFGGSVLDWESISDELSKLFRVVTLNLTHLYMGQDKITFSNQIDEIAEFIQYHYPGESVFVAGVSFGGALSWGIASRYPKLMDKIVLINPMPPNATKYMAQPLVRLFLSLRIPRFGIYLFLNSPFGRYFLRLVAGIFRNLQGTGEQERLDNLKGKKLRFVSHILWKFSWLLRSENWNDWEKKLSTWNHECMLIYDRKDPLFTPHFYDSFAQTLASENVVTTQDAGHISISQQPKLIAGAMREYFLRDFYKEAEGYN
jgi:pimeloyl-ACP methyl ester carboxylesterase